jgi:hypothetical protein
MSATTTSAIGPDPTSSSSPCRMHGDVHAGAGQQPNQAAPQQQAVLGDRYPRPPSPPDPIRTYRAGGHRCRPASAPPPPAPGPGPVTAPRGPTSGRIVSDQHGTEPCWSAPVPREVRHESGWRLAPGTPPGAVLLAGLGLVTVAASAAAVALASGPEVYQRELRLLFG